MRYIDRLRRTKTERAPLLPVLRAYDWPLFTQCLSESLLRFRPGAGVPRVAIGRPRGDGFDMLRRTALADLGMSFDELLAFAAGNLSNIPTRWEVAHRSEGTEQPVMLGLPDEGSLTSSRLLDRQRMLEAHTLIGAKVLFVGVPSQHELYVCDGSPVADRSLHKAFLRWLARCKAAAEGVDPLSEQPLVVRDGEVIGVYEAPEDGAEGR